MAVVMYGVDKCTEGVTKVAVAGPAACRFGKKVTNLCNLCGLEKCAEAEEAQNQEIEVLESIYGESIELLSARDERPTLLRVEIPVALDAGTVKLLIETPDGQIWPEHMRFGAPRPTAIESHRMSPSQIVSPMVMPEAPSAAETWCMPMAAFIAFLTIVALAGLCSILESWAGDHCEAAVSNERLAACNRIIASAPELKPKNLEPQQHFYDFIKQDDDFVYSRDLLLQFREFAVRDQRAVACSDVVFLYCSKLPIGQVAPRIETKSRNKLGKAEFADLPVTDISNHIVVQSENCHLHVYVNPALHEYQIYYRHEEMMRVPWHPDIEGAWLKVKGFVGKMNAATSDKRKCRQSRFVQRRGVGNSLYSA